MNTKQSKMKKMSKPALKVKSGVVAGASLEACMNNLNYWKNAYTQRCGLFQ